MIVDGILTLDDLRGMKRETTVFIETKQTLRPAFYMGIQQALGETEINLITPAKIAKFWKWRLYNKTWRLWLRKPTKEERWAVRWD